METTVATTTTPAALETNSAMSTISHPTSPFLLLPAELRNEIYTFIGLSTKIQVLNMQRPSKHHPFFYTIPPFLRTCKQIRSEATALIYANATFDITRGGDFSWTTRCVGAKFCTTLQISWVVSTQLLGEAIENRGRCAVCPLPNLERVEVMWASKWGRESVRFALRDWFGKEDLVVEYRDNGGMATTW